MYEFIKGTLIEESPERTIIECNGIGYRIFTPSSFHGTPGSQVTLYLSAVYREDSQKLFGFATLKERDLYEKISEVSGIGPKTALNLISHLSGDDLIMAITHSNTKLLSKVPGIGKKTAERLIIDMRDKVGRLALPQMPVQNDAINALMNLGYSLPKSKAAIEAALAGTTEKPHLGILITNALKHL